MEGFDRREKPGTIWSLILNLRGGGRACYFLATEWGCGLIFFNVRRWNLATERESDSERAWERHAAYRDGRRDAQHYFFRVWESRWNEE